jgi:predicted XRE-type DNA-binding protein
MNLVKLYLIDLLFERRKKVGENILNIIKDNGYTKSSFSRIVDLSRPTLDKLINGEIDNKATFTTHMQKIIENQKINETELLEYNTKHDFDMPTLAFSDNSPEHYERKKETKEMFMFLEDILNLCETYYK